MARFTAGVCHFQNDIFPEKIEIFRALAHVHAPEALFITCSDARIEVASLTQSEPGDLFICRNAGNIVPPGTGRMGGMAASIEFACRELNVGHIVICGHSHCGAMNGALKPDSLGELPHVTSWLAHAREAVDEVHAHGADLDFDARLRLLAERNVVLQLRNVATHESVAERLDRGDIELHGWIYDIESGHVTAYDQVRDEFVPVDEYYADELEDYVAAHDQLD